ENIVVLIALELQTPGRLPPDHRRREGSRLLAQHSKLIAFHFAARRIDPDLVPIVAGDFDRAFRGYRLLVGIECLDVDCDFVLRPVDISLWLRIDVIALTRHAHSVARRNLAPR